jgi:hypothetical protein
MNILSYLLILSLIVLAAALGLMPVAQRVNHGSRPADSADSARGQVIAMSEAERQLLLEMARMMTRMSMPAEDYRRLTYLIVQVDKEIHG